MQTTYPRRRGHLPVATPHSVYPQGFRQPGPSVPLLPTQWYFAARSLSWGSNMSWRKSSFQLCFVDFIREHTNASWRALGGRVCTLWFTTFGNHGSPHTRTWSPLPIRQSTEVWILLQIRLGAENWVDRKRGIVKYLALHNLATSDSGLVILCQACLVINALLKHSSVRNPSPPCC